VYAALFPAGGGFAELALASADRLAPMPGTANFVEAAGLVIGAGTAYEGLVDRGRLQAGETVLITAAAGGVGSAAVQIAAAVGARVVAVASPPNHDYLLSLGASEVFDYHAADWAQQVRAVVPGGVDLLFDGAGGQTRDQALDAVRDGGRAISIILQGTPLLPERGITGESFAAHGGRRRLEQLGRLVDAGTLRPQVEAVLPLEQARQALARVAGRHTRGKIVLQIGPERRRRSNTRRINESEHLGVVESSRTQGGIADSVASGRGRIGPVDVSGAVNRFGRGPQTPCSV
jgi:NADPH:quinone reductase-like Zn-dependent oxidoreductase